MLCLKSPLCSGDESIIEINGTKKTIQIVFVVSSTVSSNTMDQLRAPHGTRTIVEQV